MFCLPIVVFRRADQVSSSGFRRKSTRRYLHKVGVYKGLPGHNLMDFPLMIHLRTPHTVDVPERHLEVENYCPLERALKKNLLLMSLGPFTLGNLVNYKIVIFQCENGIDTWRLYASLACSICFWPIIIYTLQ